MSDFEERKKLLVAESEVYRQLLKLEIQTFKIYGTRAKRRMTSVTSYMPWIMGGLPFLTRLFKKRKPERSSLKRLTGLFLFGWKAYQQFAPLLARAGFGRQNTEPTESAAEEYLSKRL
ncbi:MAG TPA: hypothetical protein VKV04_16615 [Verrucomicrobiae bacterium]|nr:hypothetical protein [Verrucomicrobiae bacterium]